MAVNTAAAAAIAAIAAASASNASLPNTSYKRRPPYRYGGCVCVCVCTGPQHELVMLLLCPAVRV